MTGNLLVIYVALWALLGAVCTPILFRSRGIDIRLGVVVGIAAGLIGQLAALGPIWLFVWFGRSSSTPCPSCGQTVPRSAAYCPHCGSEKPL